MKVSHVVFSWATILSFHPVFLDMSFPMAELILRYPAGIIIYYNKFKTSNFVINDNSSPSILVLQKKNKKNTLNINLNVF